MRGNKVFFDTNILVYAHDYDHKQKHDAARKLVEQAWGRPGTAAISAQVLQELYVNMLKKGLGFEHCLQIIEDYRQWEVVDNDAVLTIEAIKISHRFKLSFWDSLILAAAVKADAATVYSEDMNHRQKYLTVTVINPFKSNE
jgi:predicted nucleic acid-binding protein